MGADSAANSVDEVAVRGIAAKMQEIYAADKTFLSFPLAAVAYHADDLRFLAPGGLSAQQAQTLGEFSELVNRLPLVSQVWSDDGTGRHLWDVYADVLGAELATSERTTAEEAAYQHAYAYLHTVMPTPPDPPSQALLDYRAQQFAYLASETAWRDGKDGPDGPILSAAKDQAWLEWKDLGHKDDVEEARLTLAGLSDKDPSVAWSRYRTQFDPGMPAAFQTTPGGMRYVTTGFAPSAVLDVPWSTMTMTRADLDAAAAGAAPELAAALASGGTAGTVKSVSFAYTAVDLTRPWLDSSMLTSRAWRFRDPGDRLSDGGSPPTGSCPAYVTKVILARSIAVTRIRPPAGSESTHPRLAFLEPLMLQVAVADPVPPVPPVDVTTEVQVDPPIDRATTIDLATPVERIGDLGGERSFSARNLRAGLTVSAMRSDEFVAATDVDRAAIIAPLEAQTIAPLQLQAVERMSRYDYIVEPTVVTEPTPEPGPTAPEDEVATTPPDVILVIAFCSRLLGTAPDPDPGLPWPT